jgi:hypothetical protein
MFDISRTIRSPEFDVKQMEMVGGAPPRRLEGSRFDPWSAKEMRLVCYDVLPDRSSAGGSRELPLTCSFLDSLRAGKASTNR